MSTVFTAAFDLGVAVAVVVMATVFTLVGLRHRRRPSAPATPPASDT